jgi:PAS domain S-box-containing protein
MKKRSKDSDKRQELRRKLIGLGEKSVRKSYYPELVARTEELTRSEERYRSIFNTINDALFIVDQQGIILEANQSACDNYRYSRDELLGKSALELITPEFHPIFQQYIEDIQTHGFFNGQTIDRRKDGTTFHTEVFGSRIVYMGKDSLLAVVRDVSERVVYEQAIETKAQELASLNQLAQEVSSSLSVEEVAHAALRQAYKVLQPDVAMLFLLQDDDLILMETYPQQSPLYDKLPSRHKVGQCLCGLAAQKEQPVYSSKISEDPLCTWHECKSAGLVSFAALPLKSGDRIIGLLSLGSLFERDFAQGAPFLQTLANEIAIGLQNAILFENEQNHAVELSLHLSALQQKEEEVRQKESHLRTIFESTTDCILSLDPDRVIRDCNSAYLSTFGYHKDEMLGRTPEFLHPSPEKFVEFGEVAYSEIRKSGSWRGEWELVHKDGTLVPVEMAISALLNDDGGLIGYVSVVRDFTERRRAEKELAATRGMLEAAIAQSPSGILIADAPDVSIRLANPAALNIRGGDKTILTGIDVGKHAANWQTFRPDGTPYPPEELPLSLAVLEGEETHGEEVIIRNEDGADRWVSVNAAPIRDIHGKVTAGIVIFHDISRRKKAEEERRANEQRLKAILEASADPVVVYDQEGRATYVNPSFSRVFGWQPDEVLGRHIPFVPDDQKSKTRETIESLFKDSAAKSLETKRTTKDGRVLDVMVSAAGIPDEDGRITGMVVNLTDLTRTKQLESQLSQAQKMEAVGTLAGGIAHDFNNILAAITGYSELALHQVREGNPAQAEIRQILKAADRAKELVQQILAFSRKTASQPKPLNLNSVISEALMIVERTIPKMISVELNLGQDLQLVNGDPNQIEQVLLNLASNAKDAMPDGGALVIKSENMSLDQDYAENHLGATPGDYVVMTVSDTGVGMDRDTLEHVFDPFYTTKEIGKGTGLGLASVYGIIQSHDGYITCYSEPGVGTTFKIYLPSLPSEEQAMEEKRDEPGLVPGGSEKVLLVDDEEALREIGTSLLELHGYDVAVAANGEEALQEYRSAQGELDLVIMDLGMPGMGGHKALLEILSINSKAKVIIASGYSADGLVKDAMESGAAGYIAKPFQKRDLLKTVRGVLDGGALE